ncbi:hypothetical protein MHBO_000667 [Bonamia ostreae]|uniref:PH domain-containing protein n=1 Tax=Bonamia ostreae TaxID=126728 RepID=A0ABV2AGE1_9EUKA
MEKSRSQLSSLLVLNSVYPNKLEEQPFGNDNNIKELINKGDSSLSEEFHRRRINHELSRRSLSSIKNMSSSSSYIDKINSEGIKLFKEEANSGGTFQLLETKGIFKKWIEVTIKYKTDENGSYLIIDKGSSKQLINVNDLNFHAKTHKEKKLPKKVLQNPDLFICLVSKKDKKYLLAHDKNQRFAWTKGLMMIKEGKYV